MTGGDVAVAGACEACAGEIGNPEPYASDGRRVAVIGAGHVPELAALGWEVIIHPHGGPPDVICGHYRQLCEADGLSAPLIAAGWDNRGYRYRIGPAGHPRPGARPGRNRGVMAADDAEARAAMAAGMAAFRERQDFYTANPGHGVPAGADPPPDPRRPEPAGLGFSRPPGGDRVFTGPVPGMVPGPLPVPAAFGADAPASVTGSSHGWGLPPDTARDAGPAVVYADAGRPPRRGLLGWLLGRG
jgi:hypothetical protein